MAGNNTDEVYHQFFNEAVATGCVWGLESPDGWALCASEKHEDVNVIPFWSQPEFAKLHQSGDWSHYNVVPISLEEFLDDWLTGMHEDVLLVGVNWDAELEGEEYEPLDILQDFDQALSG